MAILRGAGFKWLMLAAFCGFAGSAHAACTGPQALVARLQAQPTTDNAIVLGSWYASHKQFDCAVTTFRGALKKDPKSPQLNYLVGLALVDGGHPADAVSALQESVRLDSQVIKPHLMLAYVYDRIGQHAEAEEQWKQALAIDPKSTQALEGLTLDMLSRHDYKGVVLLLQSAPHTEKLAIDLAQALGNLDYLDEARTVLEQALNASPKSVPLASALTVVLIKQLRYQDAINLLQHTVEANPGNQEAELQLFRVLVLTNHINLARPIGPKLLAERPHDPEVLYLNGIVHRMMGEYPQAKALLEQAVAIEPNFFNSRYNLGMTLVFLKEWPEAKDQLEKAIALGAPEPQVHFELAKALRGLGENDQALQEMQQYQQLKKVQEAELEASSVSVQGDKALADGKVQEAIADYRQVIEGQPDNAAYLYKLAVALHQAGDTEGERTQLEKAVKINPKLAGAQNALGYLLSRSGDSAGAVEHFRLAVQAAPEWVEAWINLAAELAVSEHFDEARQASATALRLDPGNAQAQKLSDRLAHDPAAQQAHP